MTSEQEDIHWKRIIDLELKLEEAQKDLSAHRIQISDLTVEQAALQTKIDDLEIEASTHGHVHLDIDDY